METASQARSPSVLPDRLQVCCAYQRCHMYAHGVDDLDGGRADAWQCGGGDRVEGAGRQSFDRRLPAGTP
ncbi:hypothetical protein ACFY1U_09805 [Streptomyces sp. NPDC001351]|uniref:hypothetical protein n=1 Tax=Streptomyces sp. NPDC001351 TaxID=3364564 RepID=UPI00368806D4